MSRASSMSSKDFIEKILFRPGKEKDQSADDSNSNLEESKYRAERLRTIADRTDTLMSADNYYAHNSISDVGGHAAEVAAHLSDVSVPTPTYKIVPEGMRDQYRMKVKT